MAGKRRFRAEVFEGHKGGVAVEVPFDPVAWGREATFLVQGRLGAQPFESVIAHRRGRWVLMLSDEVVRGAGVAAGEEAAIVVEPAELRPAAAAVPRSPWPRRRR